MKWPFVFCRLQRRRDGATTMNNTSTPTATVTTTMRRCDSSSLSIMSPCHHYQEAKRSKRRQRLTSLGHGYVFFLSFFLFTNGIFRCYLQQQPTTSMRPPLLPPSLPHQQVNDNGTARRQRRVKAQLQHFCHHNDASTRDYHQHQHQGRRT